MHGVTDYSRSKPPARVRLPAQAGAAAAHTPVQYGDDFAVSLEVVDEHVAEGVVAEDLKAATAHASKDWEWMPQRSEDEELIADPLLPREPGARGNPGAAGETPEAI